MAERKSCPCQFPAIAPCKEQCTCRNKFLSGGCMRCCRYGTPEQQLARAKHIVTTEKTQREQNDHFRELLMNFLDWYDDTAHQHAFRNEVCEALGLTPEKDQ